MTDARIASLRHSGALSSQLRAFRLAACALACAAGVSTARADIAAPQPGVSVEAVFAALGERDFDRARAIALALDAERGVPQGATMTRFVDATRAVAVRDCATGEPLARKVVMDEPGFLPAYDLIATCMAVAGRNIDAAKLYRQRARSLDAGPEREMLLARANAVAPGAAPRLSVDLELAPSSNVNRATSAETIGAWKISDDSRSKPGIRAGARTRFEEPFISTERLLASASLATGASFDTASKAFYPTISTEVSARWIYDPRTIVSTKASLELTLYDGKRFLVQPEVRVDVSRQLTRDLSVGVGAAVSWLDFADNGRDGLSAQVAGQVQRRLGANDQVTLSAYVAREQRRLDVYSYSTVGGEVEWEHRFGNGLIAAPAVGGSFRFHDAYATLTMDKQRDRQVYGRIGLSHERLTFGGFRPEVTYTMTRQWSNDVFSSFTAHDIGLRAKAEF